MKLDRFGYSIVTLTDLSVILGMLMASCTTGGDHAVSAVSGGPAAPVEKGGAQLWSENCQRCHNVRSPNSYSAAQWEVAMLHMRVRANLTPEQHQKILEFLKSSS